MNKLRSILGFALSAAALCLSGNVALALELPRVFSHHMVLQREVPVRVWGWAGPGDTVTVSFGGQTKTARADQDGTWRVTLDPMKASVDSRELTVTARDQRVVIQDVLVGEVWICSGQSNMEWTLGGTHNAKEAIAAADYPQIRQFKVPHVTAIKPQRNLPGDWKACSPQTAGTFTGVGYHFGLQLHQELKVPIGLINSSWGGTRIEPWTDPVGFDVSPKLKDIARFIAEADARHRRDLAAWVDRVEAWIQQAREALDKGAELPDLPSKQPEHPLKNPGRPTSIYNAMIAPLVGYGIRGAIWYQGESNNGEGMLYFEKMKALISSWRRLWNQGDFPFLYVQLAPFRYKRPEALPGIWEAQLAALKIPNTGMAVITDIGNLNNIHPRNKEEVGRRLSLWALAKTYGRSELEYSGPLYESLKTEGNKAIVSFTHAAGLKSRDGKPLSWFTIAGADRKFVPAQAEIVGHTVVVHSDEVKKPAAVRFGWHELAEPNLVNAAGLPASPFRTDSW